jgi:hypothetical protein
VKYHDLIVGGQAEVALDSGADLYRGGKGSQAILGRRCAVQPAVGEPVRARIERIGRRRPKL